MDAVSETADSSGRVTLWLVICIAHALIGPFLTGYNMVLFNVPEETIRQNAAEIYIVELRWEIINAMFPIGALIGAASTGILSDRFGRRDVIFLVSIVNIVASAITASSFYFAQLLMGRLITGFASGMATAICASYLNEISPNYLRGILGSSLQLMLTLAMSVSELLGKFWIEDPYWRYGCCLGGVMSVVELSLGFTLLESPTWLHGEDRHEEANENMSKLRGNEEENALAVYHSNGNGNGVEEDRTTYEYTELSGINAVFYYSTNVLQSAGTSDPWLGSVLLSVANFVAVLCIAPFMDRIGRRKLLLCSTVGMAFSAGLITLTFVNLNQYELGTPERTDWGIAMMCCMVLFVVTFEIGLGPIPYYIVAEMTPFEYRGAMVSASQVAKYGSNTIIAATSETLLGALGGYGFLPFGCICAVGAVVIFSFVPETMHKSTRQIVEEMDSHPTVMRPV